MTNEQVDPVPQDGDERARFLDYWCDEIPDYLRAKWRDNVSELLDTPNANEKLQSAWDAWQAALAQKAVPVAVEPVRVITCPRCRGTGYHYEWCIDKPPAPIASASEAAKPAMWFVSSDPDADGFVVHTERAAKECEQDGCDVTPLYTHPAAAQPSKDDANY